MTFAQIINTIPQFYIIFAWKQPKFYMKIAQNFFPEFWGARAPLLRVWCWPKYQLEKLLITISWQEKLPLH